VQFIFQAEGRSYDLELRLNSPSATVADLVAALPESLAEVPGLLIDGVYSPGRQLLSQAALYGGAVVRLARGPTRGTVPVRPALEVRVLSGFEAGQAHPLGPRPLIVGRARDCDVIVDHPSVSRHHCRLSATTQGGQVVEDLGSTNGTWIAGSRVTGRTPIPSGEAVIEVADVQVAIGAPKTDDRHLGSDARRHGASGEGIPFNRPPRSVDSTPIAPIPIPTPPDPPSKPTFNLAALVAPLIFALVFWKLSGGNPSYVLFSLLSLVMILANWYEERSRSRRSTRPAARAYQAELAGLREALAAQMRSEVERRRQAYPDLSEVMRRSTLPSVRLWERRSGDPDFLQLTAGEGDLPWQPQLAAPEGSTRPSSPDVAAALAELGNLPLVPVPVDLSEGGVVGLIGDRAAALAMARSLLCQAACHHGPGDLAIAILTDATEVSSWDWTKWLPHTEDPDGGSGARLLAATREESLALVAGVVESISSRGQGSEPAPKGGANGRTLLMVIDDPKLIEGRNAPARALLGGQAGPIAGIVIASTEDQLPAVCSLVIDARASGLATLRYLRSGETVDDCTIAGVGKAAAREFARGLARYQDPELTGGGARLPGAVSLLPLLGIDEPCAEDIRALWRRGGPDPGAATPIGIGEDGPFELDLVRHGPHGLAGGTTGSGKSEFLRSLVAGLAANVDPDHLTFVLVDFKGGSAFDECAQLPHTVGMLSDLDGQLVDRALTCLNAELAYRERVLREAGAVDLPAYLSLSRTAAREGTPLAPLPRLVLVIDEFATLANEYPDQMATLVGVAQRGRSMGVHMILATQKPSNCVNDNIRTNSRLRIALRFEDSADSIDIIETKEAVSIIEPGRAYLRLRAGETTPIQTARVTGTSGASGAPVEIVEFRFARISAQPKPGPKNFAEPEGPTDLARLIEAIQGAYAMDGLSAPRRPWPEPLPAELDLDRVCPPPAEPLTRRPGPPSLAFALADDPAAQAQYPTGWDLGRGNLVLIGIVGSGTTTTLFSIALALARTHQPDDLHIYSLDFGAGQLSSLADLPHTGAGIGAAEHERQARLVTFLLAELARRKKLGAAARQSEPDIVLLLDNFEGFADAFDTTQGTDIFEGFKRIYADGPDVGIHTCVAAYRFGAIPGQLMTVTRQKLLFRLADVQDYGFFGIAKRHVPSFTPGRAVTAETSQVIQVARSAHPALAVTEIAGQRPVGARAPHRIEVLPEHVDVTRVAESTRLGSSPIFIPIGISDRTLAAAGLQLFDGESALVAGPPRSGKTATLWTVAHLARQADAGFIIIGVALGRSTLGDHPALDRAARQTPELAGVLASVAGDERPHLILVDDADAIEDADGVIGGVLELGRPNVHLIAAARADGLRSLYGHFTQTIRRSRLGLLLNPSSDMDGDLLGAALPRRQRIEMKAGRGYLVSAGEADLVQVAMTEQPQLASRL